MPQRGGGARTRREEAFFRTPGIRQPRPRLIPRQVSSYERPHARSRLLSTRSTVVDWLDAKWVRFVSVEAETGTRLDAKCVRFVSGSYSKAKAKPSGGTRVRYV
eukprot:1392337-Amorphochlora_amoeboformis.AAC.1